MPINPDDAVGAGGPKTQATSTLKNTGEISAPT